MTQIPKSCSRAPTRACEVLRAAFCSSVETATEHIAVV